jgi:hypothetical protein
MRLMYWRLSEKLKIPTGYRSSVFEFSATAGAFRQEADNPCNQATFGVPDPHLPPGLYMSLIVFLSRWLNFGIGSGVAAKNITS